MEHVVTRVCGCSTVGRNYQHDTYSSFYRRRQTILFLLNVYLSGEVLVTIDFESGIW